MIGDPTAGASAPPLPARAEPLSRPQRLFPALSNRPFRAFWLGMLPATLAMQMSFVATGYIAFALTGAGTVLGIVSLSVGLPMFLFSLAGGVVADRWPRRRVILTTQSGLIFSAAILALLALAGLLEVWHLVAFGFAQGLSFAFQIPARQAYIAELVGPIHLASAVALNNAGMNFSRIAGPSLAGVLLSLAEFGPAAVFLTIVALLAGVIMILVRLPEPPPPAEPGVRARRGGWGQLVEGLEYLRSSPTLLALLGLAFLPIMFGMQFQSLMPLFAERVFEVGASGLGVLMATVGAGALVGSLLIALLGSQRRSRQTQAGLGIGFGLSVAAFALAPSFGFAVAALAAVGLTSAAYGSLNNSLVMSATAAQFHGRVMSVYMATFAAVPFGALVAGWSADQVGGPITIAAAGLIVVASVAVLSVAGRGLG